MGSWLLGKKADGLTDKLVRRVVHRSSSGGLRSSRTYSLILSLILVPINQEEKHVNVAKFVPFVFFSPFPPCLLSPRCIYQ